MTIGLERFRDRRELWLDRMLLQPLRGPASGHMLDAGSGPGEGDASPDGQDGGQDR